MITVTDIAKEKVTQASEAQGRSGDGLRVAVKNGGTSMAEFALQFISDAEIGETDRVIDAGGCEFDEAFAIPFPCNAFLHLMGLPPSDLDLFLKLKDGIIRPQVLAETDDLEEPERIRADAGQHEHQRRTGPTHPGRVG